MKKAENKWPLEAEIKAAIINKMNVSGHLVGDTAIVSEFVVDGWSRRADLLIANGKLHAFEIKSASDSLTRLEGQLESYLQFFDKVTLVVSPRHEKKALGMVPTSVDVWRVGDQGEISIIRRGRTSKNNNRDTLISMLHVTEMRALLRDAGISPLPTLRNDLEDLVRSFSISELRKAVLSSIKARYAKTTLAFWKKVASGEISAAHLEALSPYMAKRERARESGRLKEKTQKSWTAVLSELPDDYQMAKWATQMPPEPLGPVPEHIKALVVTA